MSHASQSLTFSAVFHAAVITFQQAKSSVHVEIGGTTYAVERCTATFLVGVGNDGKRRFFNLDRLASVAILEG